MDRKFNKYWIIIAVITIGNILIFKFLSKQLETYVIDDIARSNSAAGFVE